jgi:hypothetical protein
MRFLPPTGNRSSRWDAATPFTQENTVTLHVLTPRPAALSGLLALTYVGKRLPLQVLRSAAGHYIGTFDGGPVTRESIEYFPTDEAARHALETGAWTQRRHL